MTGLASNFRLPDGVAAPEEAIGSTTQLAAYFEAGCKGSGEQLLGVEYERLPLCEDGTAAPFAGDDVSVSALLRFLMEAADLEPEVVEGHVLGLAGSGDAVHLEPGGQPELALAPKRTAVEVLQGLERWRELLVEAAHATGIHVAAIGLQPVTPIDRLSWVPKERYRIMRSHLSARGALACHMMAGTAGLQLNLDYASEDDAAGLIGAALAVAPLANAFVLNSPLEDGRLNGYLSKRPEIWLQTDPDRCGLLPWVLDEGFTFARYADWALSVPVMFVVRDGRWHRPGDMSFARFVEAPGALGPVSLADWHLHLTTLFPEVRIKQHVEVRGADSCSIEEAAGLTALWRGVLYDAESRAAARSMMADLDAEARLRLHRGVGRRGFDEPSGRATVREASRELLRIAESGLGRLDDGEQDASLLDPLRRVLEDGRSPAARLRDAWSGEAGALLALV